MGRTTSRVPHHTPGALAVPLLPIAVLTPARAVCLISSAVPSCLSAMRSSSLLLVVACVALLACSSVSASLLSHARRAPKTTLEMAEAMAATNQTIQLTALESQNPFCSGFTTQQTQPWVGNNTLTYQAPLDIYWFNVYSEPNGIYMNVHTSFGKVGCHCSQCNPTVPPFLGSKITCEVGLCQLVFGFLITDDPSGEAVASNKIVLTEN